MAAAGTVRQPQQPEGRVETRRPLTYQRGRGLLIGGQGELSAAASRSTSKHGDRVLAIVAKRTAGRVRQALELVEFGAFWP